MPEASTNPIIYLITGGETDAATTPESEEFARLVALARAAAGAGVSIVQLREKRLRPRVLYELAARSAAALTGSATRLLVNDRADIARAAGADGVHLAATSPEVGAVRRAFGEDFLIGVSTHTLEEARAARDGGADFAVFGPVFDTPSKRAYGTPAGLEKLRAAAHALAPFPVLAVGGVARDNFTAALAAGARGVAAIRLFAEADGLSAVVREITGANF